MPEITNEKIPLHVGRSVGLRKVTTKEKVIGMTIAAIIAPAWILGVFAVIEAVMSLSANIG